MDDTTKIKITAESDLRAFEDIKKALADIDQAVLRTHAAQQKATSGNIKDLQAWAVEEKNLAKVQQTSGVTLEKRLKEVGVSQKAFIDLIKQQAATTNQTASATRGMAGELASMAAQYGSAYYAVTKLVGGFNQFSKTQESLRVIQARTSATSKEMSSFATEMHKVGAALGMADEEVLAVAESFREAGYTTPDAAKKMMGAISSMARQYGVSATEMGESLGSFMKAMNIEPTVDNGIKALRMLAHAQNTMRLDMGQLNRYAPQLATSMADMGLKGEKGMATVLAMLGTAREQFGSTTLAARALNMSLSNMQSTGGGLAGSMGLDPDQWANMMEEMSSSGGDSVEFMRNEIKKSLDAGYTWAELFPNMQERKLWKSIVTDEKAYLDYRAKNLKAQSDESIGRQTSLNNAALATERLSHAWGEMWESIGSAADAAGATALLTELTNQLLKVADGINKIVEGAKNLRPDTIAEGVAKVVNPVTAGAAGAYLGGPVGAAAGIAAGVGVQKVEEMTRQGPKGVTGAFGGIFDKFRPFAEGGVVTRATAGIVGERGPEAIIPLTGALASYGTVKNISQTLSAMGEQGWIRNGVKDVASIRSWLNAWDSFQSYFDTVPAQEQESALYQFHRVFKPGVKMSIDALLGWGKLTPGKKGMGLPETSIAEATMRHYLPRDKLPGAPPLMKKGWGLDSLLRAVTDNYPEERALGGSVTAGSSYLVGERGPEILRSGSSGYVTGNATFEDIDKNTERSMDILDEIRDILQREEMDREEAAGRGTGPGGPGGPGGTGNGPGGTGGGGGGDTGAISGEGGNTPVGGSKYPRMAEIKSAMKEQFIKEGAPPAAAEEAANAFVGQAIAESGLKSQFHDKGKVLGRAGGYVPSIYGADRSRGKKMVDWITSQGGDPNDTVWQGRYMAHEAMSGGYKRTKAAIMSGNRNAISTAATVEFEAPAARHDPGTQAYRRGLADMVARSTAAGGDTGAGGDTERVATRGTGIRPELIKIYDRSAQATGLYVGLASGVRPNTARHGRGYTGDFRLYADKERTQVVMPDDPRAIEFARISGLGGAMSGGAGYMSSPELIDIGIAKGRGGFTGAYSLNKSPGFKQGFEQGIKERQEALARGENPTAKYDQPQIAATQPMPPVQSFQKGGYVNRTGPAYLHEGETVIPKYADFRKSENIEDRRNERGSIRRSLGKGTTAQEAIDLWNQQETETATPNRLAAEAGMADVLAKEKPWSNPMAEEQRLQEIQRWRSEMEKPITIRAKMDRGPDAQFRRASIDQQVDLATRQAAWDSFSDLSA